MRIAICDDETLFLENESNIISKYLDKKNNMEYNIDKYESGKEFLINNKDDISYDVVFLDINMDDIDGLETARQIRKKSDKVQLVFITGYITYALEGYKVNAVRYILKDEKTLENAIEECMDSIIKQMDSKHSTITFSFREGTKNILIEDITYIESNLHYLTFHLNDSMKKQYTLYEKLDDIEKILDTHSFCRIHKSYLVNLKFVDQIERYQMKMKDGHILNIAKPRYQVVREKYICYEGEL